MEQDDKFQFEEWKNCSNNYLIKFTQRYIELNGIKSELVIVEAGV